MKRFCSTTRLNARRVSDARTSDRTGSLLVQMLVVITLLGVITTAAIATISSMMRIEGRSARVWINHHNFSRLTDDLRRDVHAARSGQIVGQEGTASLVLRSDEAGRRAVTYVATAGLVTRRETDGAQLIRTEEYRVPDWTIHFEPSSPAVPEPRAVSVGDPVELICRRPYSVRSKSRAPQPEREDRVLSVLGRDHRFEKSTAQQKTSE